MTHEEIQQAQERARKDDAFFKGYVISELAHIKDQMPICREKFHFLESTAYKLIGGLGAINLIIAFIILFDKLYRMIH